MSRCSGSGQTVKKIHPCNLEPTSSGAGHVANAASSIEECGGSVDHVRRRDSFRRNRCRGGRCRTGGGGGAEGALGRRSQCECFSASHDAPAATAATHRRAYGAVEHLQQHSFRLRVHDMPTGKQAGIQLATEAAESPQQTPRARLGGRARSDGNGAMLRAGMRRILFCSSEQTGSGQSHHQRHALHAHAKEERLDERQCEWTDRCSTGRKGC